MWSVRQINGGKLIMQLETHVGSELPLYLPLTLFSVNHPGQATVKVNMF